MAETTTPVVAPVSGLAASILIDLLGAEMFADEAVAYAVAELPPLTDDQKLLVRVGATKAALLVMTEVRKFVGRDDAS
jgi:hypothetical protein